MHRKKLLEDTFTFEKTPFLVRVEERKMYVHPRSREIRGINTRGHPTGKKKTPRGWYVCRCRVATLRPDYPYTEKKKWPESVERHFEEYEPLEWPKKRDSWFRWRRKKVPREPERDVQELAADVVEKMKNAYESRVKVESLEEE